MYTRPVLQTVKVFPMTQQQRLHHCYRPIKYCDWYKPENEIYYELRCPPCNEPKPCKPRITCEKTCKMCSFWEQMKDNCCKFWWPLPPMPIPSEGRVYICKDMRKKKINAKEAKIKLDKRIFQLHDCYDIAECPEPNWEVLKP